LFVSKTTLFETTFIGLPSLLGKKMQRIVLFGLIYTIVYWFLAIWNIGPEGKGTTIFFAPLIAWLFLFVALFLVDNLFCWRNGFALWIDTSICLCDFD
jgi:hypothetical protein